MQGQRNNFLAGLLVVFTILGVVAAVVMIGSGLDYVGKDTYRVRFSLGEGVSGLKRGAGVRVGGVPAGNVKSVRFQRNAAGSINGVIVEISIDSDIVLRENAVAELESPLLGTVGTINFPTLGAGAPLGPDDVLEGNIAPPSIFAQAGYGDEQKGQVRNILQRFSEIGDKFSDAGDKAIGVLDDTKIVTGDFETKWPEWRGRVDSVTENLDRTVERGPEIAASVEERIETIRQILEENRQPAKEGIASFQSGTEQFDQMMTTIREEYLAIAEEILDNANAAVADVGRSVSDVRGLIDEELPGVRRTLANLRLGSDQLRDTLVEVRRSPWRLIYRPDLRQLDYELLYSTARHYASSVEELRAATEALRGVVRAADQTRTVDQETVQRLLAGLEDAFTDFRAAQDELMRELMQRSPENQ